jgi:hypothetical protein
MSWLCLLVQNPKSHPPAINAARPSSILQRYPTPEMPFHNDCTKAALIIKLINLQAPFLALDFHSVEELVYLISNLPWKEKNGHRFFDCAQHSSWTVADRNNCACVSVC